MTDKTIVALYDDLLGAVRAMAVLEKAGLSSPFTLFGNAQAKAQAGLAGINNAGEGFLTAPGVIYDSAANRVSRLTGMGVSQDDAEHFAEAVRRGGVLLVGRMDRDRADRALALVEEHGPVDIGQRASAWRAGGWTGYDVTQPDYAEPQASEERSRHATGSHATGTGAAAASIRDTNRQPTATRVRSYTAPE